MSCTPTRGTASHVRQPSRLQRPHEEFLAKFPGRTRGALAGGQGFGGRGQIASSAAAAASRAMARLLARITRGARPSGDVLLPGDNPLMTTGRPAEESSTRPERGACGPTCGWPADRCRCSSRLDERSGQDRGEAPVREQGPRRQKRDAGGRATLQTPSSSRSCCVRSRIARDRRTVREGSLELQGDRRDALRALLTARGFAVKG